MTTFPIYQLNVNRSILPCKELLDQTKDLSPFIIAVTEPPSFTKVLGTNETRNNTYGLDNKHISINRYTPNRRSILYCHSSLPIWPETRFSARDLAVAIWSKPFPNVQQIALLSYHWACDEPNISPLLLNCIDTYNSAGIPIILMTDSNAHSSAWGDKKTDSRGEQLEDLLIRT